jgi:hypothetical protein
MFRKAAGPAKQAGDHQHAVCLLFSTQRTDADPTRSTLGLMFDPISQGGDQVSVNLSCSRVHSVETLRCLVVVHDNGHDNGAQADCRNVVEVRDTKVLLRRPVSRSSSMTSLHFLHYELPQIGRADLGRVDRLPTCMRRLRVDHCYVLLTLKSVRLDPGLRLQEWTWPSFCRVGVRCTMSSSWQASGGRLC